MRVVTWNIKFGREIDRAIVELKSRRELLAADVLLLQEMDESGTRRIADELGVDFAFAAAGAHPETGRDFGNAVLSRWPVGDLTEIELPHVARIAGQPRSATHVKLQIEGAGVSVYSVHTETVLLSHRRRREQFSAFVDHIATLESDRPVIVGGDFNTTRRRDIDRLTSLMASAGVHPVTRRVGPTLRRFGVPFTLDHVFARGLTALDSRAVTDTTASDHRPVWVDLELSG